MALSVSVAVSNILGYALPMLFLSAAGLPGAFIIPGTVSLVSAAAVMIFMRRVSPPRQKTTRVSLIRLGLDRRTRVFLLPAFLHGIIKDNLALWMPLLFSTLYGGLSGILTVMYILMSPIMMLVGRLIYPLIYRLLFRDERYVCIVSFSVIVSALIPLAAADVSAPLRPWFLYSIHVYFRHKRYAALRLSAQICRRKLRIVAAGAYGFRNVYRSRGIDVRAGRLYG